MVAREHPQWIAIRESAREHTYGELCARAEAIAARLDESAAGDRVACILTHGGEMLAAILGVLAGGRAYVSLDPMHPRERTELVLDDSGATTILCDEPHVALARKLAGARHVVVTTEAISGGKPVRRPTPDSTAYCLYTSGSTGRPKGVTQSHRNVAFFIDAYRHALEIKSTDVLSLLSTFAFDAAVVDVFSALLSGATLCPYDLRQLGPAGLADMLERRRVTVYHSTPTVFRELVRIAPRISERVRLVVLGGEEVFAEDVARVRASFGPATVLVNGYGMTECSWALLQRVPSDMQLEGRQVPLGTPLVGVEVSVILDDPELAASGVGTIQIKCAHVAPGYWQRPDETAAAFPAPETYVTTDLGRVLPDGRVEFAGRKASQVKLRGYRIDVREIEAVLARHPAIREATVVLRDGPDGPALVAYVVIADGHLDPSRTELRGHLATTLPYYMLPALIVTLPELPRGATGKVDRRALPTPGPESFTRAEYIAPRDEIETALAQIWRDLLRVEKVGVHDDFFALGGHSLLAIRLLSNVARQLGARIPLRELFADSTLEGLAAKVNQSRASAVERPTLHASSTRRARLPPALRGVFKLNKMMTSDHFARHVWSAWIDGPLDLPSLEKAVAAMRARHALLRTRFFDDDKHAMLEVLDLAQVARFALIERIDLTGREDREQADEDFHRSASYRPLDVGHGEVMSVALSTWSATRHRISVSLHNIVSDGDSLTIYVEELCELWRAFVADREPALPAALLQYHHLADYLERVSESDIGRAHHAFWAKTMDGIQPLVLPIDSPREDVDARREANAGVVAFRSGSVARELPKDLLTAIERTAEGQRASVMSTLVAAMGGYLSERTSQQDLSFITRLSHRYMPGLEGALGFLVNPLLLRVSTAGAPAFSELLSRTHAVVTDAFDHGECDLFELAPYSAFRFCLVYQRRAQTDDGPPSMPPGLVALRAPTPDASAGSQIGYDLLLWLKHFDDRVELYLAYNLELFRDSTAAEFLDGYVTYLNRV
ncbi:MAG TPA: amino acid adenylation domain-containing protein [Kofleriaceae bacterium]